jgi:hypothetical protein
MNDTHLFFGFPTFSARIPLKRLLKVVEMRIWCIKIGIGLVLNFNPWAEASAGGLLVPEGLYSPVVKYFGTYLKIRI